MIEGAQLVLKKGLFELDDIVTNTIGAVLGWLLYAAVARGVRLWRRRRPGKAE
jgi:glycopeptide antibiotics resistance protein